MAAVRYLYSSGATEQAPLEAPSQYLAILHLSSYPCCEMMAQPIAALANAIALQLYS